MLCQLVCVDRRYQRMNCFNIREIQSILKRRFFTDLINSKDHHELTNKTAIGLRYKTNDLSSLAGNTSLFYNYGTSFTPKSRSAVYNSFSGESNASFFNLENNQNNAYFNSLITKSSDSLLLSKINNLFLQIINLFPFMSADTFFFIKKKLFNINYMNFLSFETLSAHISGLFSLGFSSLASFFNFFALLKNLFFSGLLYVYDLITLFCYSVYLKIQI